MNPASLESGFFYFLRERPSSSRVRLRFGRTAESGAEKPASARRGRSQPGRKPVVRVGALPLRRPPLFPCAGGAASHRGLPRCLHPLARSPARSVPGRRRRLPCGWHAGRADAPGASPACGAAAKRRRPRGRARQARLRPAWRAASADRTRQGSCLRPRLQRDGRARCRTRAGAASARSPRRWRAAARTG
jgi:hypothetical protein